MDEMILWRASSTSHDWSDGRFLDRLLGAASDLGLVGPSTWLKAGIHGEREPTAGEHAADLARALPEPGPDEPAAAALEFGGDAPHPWAVTLSAARPGARRTPPNMAWIWFDRQWAGRGPVASDRLAAAFADVHTPADTDYAFVHPYTHWLDLSESAYRRPVTSGSMFRGIWWLNFLGPGQIKEFQTEALRALPVAELQWTDDEALMIRAYQDMLSADEPGTAERLVDLTEAFREALLPNSRWR